MTHWYAADAVNLFAIAVLIAKGAWDLLSKAIDIVMESTPKSVNRAQLARDVVRVPGASDVHDLHVWSISGSVNALSAHLEVEGDRALSDCNSLLEQLNKVLALRYWITRSTIQFECANCDLHHSDLYCSNSNYWQREQDRTSDGLEVVKWHAERMGR